MPRPLVQHPHPLADGQPDARPMLDRALEDAARLGREVWVFSSCRLPPPRSLLPSDLAQCAIEILLLALLRVLLGWLGLGAVRHSSAVIGERRLELFAQLSLGQLQRLRHSGPFENPRMGVRTKKGLGVSRGRPTAFSKAFKQHYSFSPGRYRARGSTEPLSSPHLYVSAPT
jgi:hypothetical protein